MFCVTSKDTCSVTNCILYLGVVTTLLRYKYMQHISIYYLSLVAHYCYNLYYLRLLKVAT